MQMPVGDVLPELLLIVGGAVVLVFALFAPRRHQAWSAAIALATIAGAAALIISRLGAPQVSTFFGTYALDGAAAWGKLIVLGVTAAVVGLSVPWFRQDSRQGEYYTLLLYSALGAILLAGALDLMELVLALLMSSATGYVLVAYHRRSKVASEAAIKYYLLGALTNAGLWYGVALLFGLGGTTIFAQLRGPLAGSSGSWVLGAVVGFVVVGLAFKMGAVPAHAWMPDVAEGAPVPVAAFLRWRPRSERSSSSAGSRRCCRRQEWGGGRFSRACPR
jgi:NADH-quinone oxidoreductase subunit N